MRTFFGLKTVSKVFLERSRALLDNFFGPLEASKSAPRGPQEAEACLSRFLTPPSGLQDPFWSHFRPIWEAILEPCWDNFGSQRKAKLKPKESQRKAKGKLEEGGQAKGRPKESQRKAKEKPKES